MLTGHLPTGACMHGLARRKLNHTRQLPNNAGVRGSIVKVAHMVVIHTKQEWEQGLTKMAEKTALRPPLRMKHGEPVPLEG